MLVLFVLLSFANIGANIFNLVLVSGLSTVFSPFPVPNKNQVWGINSSLVIDIPVMLLVMTLLTIPALVRGKLSRWQGIALLLFTLDFAHCNLQFSCINKNFKRSYPSDTAFFIKAQ